MHFISVGKNNYGPRIAPDRVFSGTTSFTGSVAMDFMPEHAPIDPIEGKLRVLRCKTTENRWAGYTQTHCKQQVKYHPMASVQAPGQLAEWRRAHEPSAFLQLNAGILLLLGRLEHART